MGEGRWEHFEHQADVGVRGMGPTADAAFEQAALALTAVLVDPKEVAERERIGISCEAPDLETLFYDWLNAIVYEMATRSMLFGRYEARIEGNRLRGAAWGEAVDVARHSPAVEVKGATYTSLSVRRDERGEWLAQCVVDV